MTNSAQTTSKEVEAILRHKTPKVKYINLEYEKIQH